jgi:hypothetical protein
MQPLYYYILSGKIGQGLFKNITELCGANGFFPFM